jgi:hypothetical protein
MDRQILRDKNGNRIGEIETDGYGVQIARDVNNNRVGTYDPRFNKTYDRNGRCIGEGNLLASLLVPQKRKDRDEPLLWGLIGYLLGSSALKTNLRRYVGEEGYETVTKNKGDGVIFRIVCVLETFAVFGILILGVLGRGGRRFEFTFPAKQIAAIYYYGLAVPLKWILSPWRYIYTESLTNYPNLNMVLAIGAIVIIVVVAIFIVRLFFRTLGKFAWSLLALFLLGPWLFWAVWGIYKWLSEQSK